MKPKFFLVSVATLAFSAAVPGVASTVTDVAWITGVASVGIPLGLQAATRSTLSVKVDVYRETFTLPIYAPDNKTLIRWDYGQKAFGLEQPTALMRQRALLAELKDPVSQPSAAGLTAVAQQLGVAGEKLKASGEGLDRFIKQAATLAENKLWTTMPGLLAEAKQRREAVSNTIAAISAYEAKVSEASRDGVFSAEEQESAAMQLLGIRLASQAVAQDFSEVLGAYFQSRITTYLNKLLIDAKPLALQPKQRVMLTKETLRSKAELRQPGEPQTEAVQRQIWHTVSLIRQLEKSQRQFIDADQKQYAVTQAQIETAKSNIAGMIGKLGFDGDASQLFAIDRESEFRLYWDGSFIDGAIRRAAKSANDATYVGVNVGANFGPIANEVIQGLFSQSKMIDQVVSNPGRWKTYNSAVSKGSAGTHNAIIYFENMLTPVLKSATFDPSQLLLANAQIYKRATSIVAQVYGAPTAADITSGKADESLNLMSLEARKLSATNGEKATRAELLASLRSLLDEHTALAALLKADDKNDWADYPGAARAKLEKLATQLAATAASLEQP
ncbi:hypothetical protein [Oleiharenicola lentus]|uniref:hypothetical protein n=1 Tax=Oleiharenicola lentus TaxID=2508720 RepID=UPI003F674764